jgi:hypothetical protein
VKAQLYAHGVSDKVYEKSDQLELFSLMYIWYNLRNNIQNASSAHLNTKILAATSNVTKNISDALLQGFLFIICTNTLMIYDQFVILNETINRLWMCQKTQPIQQSTEEDPSIPNIRIWLNIFTQQPETKQTYNSWSKDSE